MGIRNLSLVVAVRPEVRNNILGGLPAMRATNDRDGVCSAKVIEEFAAFLVLALKYPRSVAVWFCYQACLLVESANKVPTVC